MIEKGDPKTLKTATEAFSVGESVCHALIAKVAMEGGSAVDVSYCLAQLGVSIIQNIASIIAQQPPEVKALLQKAKEQGRNSMTSDEFNPNKQITAESKLFAALLMYQTSPDYDREQCGSTSEYGPHVYWETINAFEKLQGKAPDPYIIEGMIKAGRKVGEMGSEVLQAFMERQKLGREGGSSSLN